MKAAIAVLAAYAVAGQVQAGEQPPLKLSEREAHIARYSAHLASAVALECFTTVSVGLLANESKRRGMSDDEVRALLLNPNKPPLRRREVEAGLAARTVVDTRFFDLFQECMERSSEVEDWLAKHR